uniref:Uncharacterized protein n=1 Tax=Chromera velia CCMP2878 TaxID=1169474 RepID=A0A0G4FQF9_9ALVE|eukprot:Cvel_438.t1-p1 / transcript=Cvel_438.t1 / gene=Cvel_438 / organism=Chromera_velia_CCMP2878 / gene_product=hypothetical protein / transcript_product=hypothetical protein / location=Cvel_scaffold14:79727-81292(-) / protein_length=522 / sequence_SO=supercontig / SO=protein_coding / is_pseudo=false
MDRTASPVTFDAFLERLRTVEDAVFPPDQTARRRGPIIEKLFPAQLADSKVTSVAATGLCMRRKDVAVLEKVERLCFAETATPADRANTLVKELDKLVNKYYEIDLGVFFEPHLRGIGEVIRSFRAVSAKALQKAVSEYGTGKKRGEDLRLLLKAGADVDGLSEGQTVLMKTISADNYEAMEEVVRNGCSLEVRAGDVCSAPISLRRLRKGDTALMAACRQGRWEMILFLAEEVAVVDFENPILENHPLCLACEAAEHQLDPDETEEGDEWRLHYNPERRDPSLRFAVRRALNELLDRTSDDILRRIRVNASHPSDELRNSETLLHFFTWHSFHELMREYVRRTKGPGCRDPTCTDVLDSDGRTPLHICTGRAKPATAHVLVLLGADVAKHGGDGDTPLIKAVSRRRTERTMEESFISDVKEVIDRIDMPLELEVNARGYRGDTALHRAVQWGVFEIVKWILDMCADVNVRNDSGRTAHNQPHGRDAITSEHPEIVSYLEAWSRERNRESAESQLGSQSIVA